jgi:C-terminal processing protease CtpA/Prc
MKKINPTIIFILFTKISLFAQNESLTELSKRFLDTVQTNAYLAKNVNWDSIRPIVLEKASKIEDPNKLLPVFNDVISGLNDLHSSVIFNKYVDGQPSEKSMIEKLMKMSDKDLGFKPKHFDHRMIDNKYAYINIPAVMSEHGNYIDTMRNQISFLDSKKPKAWIIDLTENHGGSYLPMIWNLYNLIDKNHNFSMHHANGNEKLQEVVFNNDTEDETMRLFFDVFDLKNKKPYKIKNNKVPIIVLTSNLTASSGEIMTAFFLGQKNVRVIGQRTMGMTTGNDAIKLNNSFVINLAIATFKDRKGKIYEIGESISPDILIDFDFKKHAKTGEKINLELAEKILIENKDPFIKKAIQVIENGGNS